MSELCTDEGLLTLALCDEKLDTGPKGDLLLLPVVRDQHYQGPRMICQKPINLNYIYMNVPDPTVYIFLLPQAMDRKYLMKRS